jgi:hypothetical protein
MGSFVCKIAVTNWAGYVDRNRRGFSQCADWALWS